MRQFDDARFGTATLRPVVEVIHDPLEVVEAAADAQSMFDRAAKRATPWMQRLRQGARPRVRVRSASGVPEFDGRACCADYLRRFDGRADLQFPFETTCPGCQRRFRVRLDLVTETR